MAPITDAGRTLQLHPFSAGDETSVIVAVLTWCDTLNALQGCSTFFPTVQCL